MENKTIQKLSQLYVDETLHKDIKGLAKLRQQDIKVVVTNLFKAEFKTDHFFAFCKGKFSEYLKEKSAFGERDIMDFDGYCATHLEYLKDEFHKSL